MTNNHFVTNTLSELEAVNHSPIFGYENSPVLTIEEAVENLIPLVPRIIDYVATAKKKFNPHSSLLTRDESAVLYLYTMPTPVFSTLNNTLRSKNKQELKPWFAFLKLFLTALNKLPSTKATIWRGVNYDDTLTFVNDDMHVWWSINSCSKALDVVQRYLGDNGTVFAIDAIDAKDISMLSAIEDEQEVVLMPGTHVRRRCQSLNFMDRLFIVHLEQIYHQSESHTKSNYLFDRIKQVYQRNNRIHRVIDPTKSFPIQQSYINLSTVNSKEQQEKEKQLHDKQHHNNIIGSFEEIYATKASVDLNDIFQKCQKEQKQVLIFGRAGIGKSTFCRYVAYQWAIGNLWSQYELLVLIPLRCLITNRYPSDKSYSLIDLIKKELLRYDLSEQDEAFLKKIFDRNKTLWILDGYDEIVNNVPSHLEYLFEQLLNTPHHIITSRPYMNTLSYDVQMEITGFTDTNIEEYIQLFFYQMKDEFKDAAIKSQALLDFLKRNRSIWGVAHIPINLELICSVWSTEHFSDTKVLTITELYTIMTEWMLRRYLTPPNKQILQLSEEEIDQTCDKELKFLETLAYNAMKQNTIILRPRLLKKALNEAQVSMKTGLNILNIGFLKSLSKQGIDTQIQLNKDHYFVHLSFQEYFTARYLINSLKNDVSQEVVEFIKYQKYNQRYTLVFTFATGLAARNHDERCMNLFWDILLGEPSDLVGIRHIPLIIYCLEEISNKISFPRTDSLFDWLAECLKHLLIMKNEFVLRHIILALRITQSVVVEQKIMNTLLTLLTNDDPNTRREVLLLIRRVHLSNPPPTLVTLLITVPDDENNRLVRAILDQLSTKAVINEVLTKLVTAIEDENKDVRQSACYALGRLGGEAATNEVISKLVNALGHEKEYVRRSACDTLECLGEKAATNEVLTKLVTALEDENEDVRQSACYALGRLGGEAATNEVISKLVNALGDENPYIRECVCQVLGRLGEKAATNEVIGKLATALGDENPYIREHACQALGRLGEKAATKEVLTKLVTALGHEKEYVRRSACYTLERLGEKAATNEVISKLVAALADQNEYIRANACQVLGQLGEKAAVNDVVSKLVSASGDKNEDVRWAACKTLRQLGDKVATNEVISKLVTALSDQNEYIRANACQVLGQLGEKAAINEVINKLVTVLEDEAEDVRASAYYSLGQLGGKAAMNEVMSKLMVGLGDQNEYVRRSACYALGELGEKVAADEVISKLATTLEDKNEDVRASACQALGKLGEKAATNDVISKLVAALADRNEYIRTSACQVLGQLGEKAATDEVISKLATAFADERGFVRTTAWYALGRLRDEAAAANEVISKLLTRLGDRNEYVRASACQVLGQLGEKVATNEVVTRLVTALEDENEDVRRHACIFLGGLGKKVATNEVISKLVTALEDKNPYIREHACQALGRLGEKAAIDEIICKLVTASEDENRDVRRSALQALGMLGEKAATNEVISKLIVLVNSSSYSSRWSAISALERISTTFTVITQLNPEIVGSLCLSEYGVKILKNVAVEQLVKFALGSIDMNWFSVVTQFALVNGIGITMIGEKIVLYDKKEPVEISVSNRESGSKLFEALKDQRTKLHLCLEDRKET